MEIIDNAINYLYGNSENEQKYPGAVNEDSIDNVIKKIKERQ